MKVTTSIFGFFLGLCLLLAMASAPAATLDISSHLNNDGRYSVFSDPVVPFTDIYNFSLSSNHDTIFVAGAINFPPYTSIPDFAMKLFDNHDAMGNELANGTSLEYAIASGAPYSIQITGTPAGSDGGHYYFFARTIAPVPLPAAGWLMLSALILVMLITNHRRERPRSGLMTN